MSRIVLNPPVAAYLNVSTGMNRTKRGIEVVDDLNDQYACILCRVYHKGDQNLFVTF